MKLSTKGRYAVMAMADLGTNSDGSPVSLADIAVRQEISLSYLEQLFGKLRKSGVVKSVRGPGGGYLLARESSGIRISDIILAVDEPLTATRCSNSSSEGCRSDKGRCLTHDLWQSLSHQIYLHLNSITLEDVCEGNVPGTRPDMFPEIDPATFAAE
ncbi:MAG: Rrf2 family transcriptional regulator [Rhodospirillaceae bacterium]|nr:Rrf2 family transcriptional regulator [Rhodospirillaceae bacterium]